MEPGEAGRAKVRSCALGPCDDSVERGGKGCYLCDTVAKLKQPRDHKEGLLKADKSAKTKRKK